tara:strand:+ start:58 stop:474 length:417 start_codon:yes stop_codon:yes gene_type:complete
MDTDKLIQLAQRIYDRAQGNPELEPGLEQLKRLLKLLETNPSPEIVSHIITAALMLDITIGQAKAPYKQEEIEAIMGDFAPPGDAGGTQDHPAARTEISDAPEDSSTPLPAAPPAPGDVDTASTNPYLDYMHSNSKLY